MLSRMSLSLKNLNARSLNSIVVSAAGVTLLRGALAGLGA